MTKRWMVTGLLAVLVLSVLGMPAVVRAQAQPPTEPPTLDPNNPFSSQVTAARQALDQSIQQFWQDDYSNPWDFTTLESDYQAYVDAWYAYMDALRQYWDWERNNLSFSGRVTGMTPCPPQPLGGPLYPCDPVVMPVAGATVSLTTIVPIGIEKPLAASNSSGGTTTATTSPQGPVSGAAIVPGMPVRLYSAVTDSSGQFKISPVPQGSYNYSVTAAGYETATGTVTIAGSGVQQTIMLKRAAPRGFNGRVVTNDWPVPLPLAAGGQAGGNAPQGGAPSSLIYRAPRPVAGAEVVVRRRFVAIPLQAGGTPQAAPKGVAMPPFPWGEWKQVTDASGHFSFSDLPDGDFEYTVADDDFTPASGTFTLAQNVVTRDIYLTHTHELRGVVLTPAPRIMPLLQPLIASTGGAATTADVARKQLDAIPNLPLPWPERLVPVAGATVAITPQIVYQPETAAGRGAPSSGTSPESFYNRTTITGPDGSYDFQGLRDARYFLTISKDGYTTFKGSLELQGGTTVRDVVIFPVLAGPPIVEPLQQKVIPATGGKSLENPFGK